jgi:hypothetical protein
MTDKATTAVKSAKHGRRCQNCRKRMRFRKDGCYPRVCRACYGDGPEFRLCCLEILLNLAGIQLEVSREGHLDPASV